MIRREHEVGSIGVISSVKCLPVLCVFSSAELVLRLWVMCGLVINFGWTIFNYKLLTLNKASWGIDWLSHFNKRIDVLVLPLWLLLWVRFLSMLSFIDHEIRLGYSVYWWFLIWVLTMNSNFWISKASIFIPLFLCLILFK